MKIAHTLLLVTAIAAAGLVYRQQKADHQHAAQQAEALSQALTLLTRAERASDTFMRQHQRRPHSDEELGLPGPELQASGHIRALRVVADGSIVAELQDFPQVSDAWIRVQPDAARWNCTTNIPFIERFALPGPCPHAQSRP